MGVGEDETILTARKGGRRRESGRGGRGLRVAPGEVAAQLSPGPAEMTRRKRVFPPAAPVVRGVTGRRGPHPPRAAGTFGAFRGRSAPETRPLRLGALLEGLSLARAPPFSFISLAASLLPPHPGRGGSPGRSDEADPRGGGRDAPDRQAERGRAAARGALPGLRARGRRGCRRLLPAGAGAGPVPAAGGRAQVTDPRGDAGRGNRAGNAEGSQLPGGLISSALPF